MNVRKNFRINLFNFNEILTQKLSKYGINTAQDLLTCSRPELLNTCFTSVLEMDKLIIDTSKLLAPSIKTVSLLKHQRKCLLKTTISLLDLHLKGGIVPGTLTEIAGPSGGGKTQFCLMLCVSAMLPKEEGGLGGSVLFVDSEATFSAKRLIEIAHSRFPHYFSTAEQLKDLCERILVCHLNNVESLTIFFSKIENFLVEKQIKLIIFDSLTSLLRKEREILMLNNPVHFSQNLLKVAAMLKNLAELLNASIVGTNQIVTRWHKNCVYPEFGAEVDINAEEKLDNDETWKYIPALGNTWAYCINIRIILQFDQSGCNRQLLVVKSPSAESALFLCCITDAGIMLIDDRKFLLDDADTSLQFIRTQPAVLQDIY